MRPRKFRLLSMNPKYWTIILLILTFFFAAGYRSQQRQLEELTALIDTLNTQRDQLTEELLRLQRKIDFSKTDAFIEREARSKLGLIYEGEILFKRAD